MWDVTKLDPQYHFDAIVDAMKATIERAKAEGFGDIQAVDGNVTGTVSPDNEAMWCDIFSKCATRFLQGEGLLTFSSTSLRRWLAMYPLEVISDGKVTALAAVQNIAKEMTAWCRAT